MFYNYIQTLFLLHVCQMILLYFTQYFRPTLKKNFKSLIVWVERKQLISHKIKCVFSKCFETLTVLWNIDCLQFFNLMPVKWGFWNKKGGWGGGRGEKSLAHFNNALGESLRNAIDGRIFRKCNLTSSPYN